MAKNLVFQEIFDGGASDKVSSNLDTTLTQSGKAADAKAVGDKFKDYAKTSALSDYAKTSDLEGYAEKDDLVQVDSSLLKQGQAADALVTGNWLRDFENWHEEHSANGQHHLLDTTLTQQGQGADAKAVGDALKSYVSTTDLTNHNADDEAHNDIRIALQELNTKLSNFLDIDEPTLDELSEIITQITNNKTLIEGITTSKVNVTDIIDNLTTSVSNKPLSAKQGVALKALIDALVIPTKVSELTNDSGYLTSYTETDPTVPAWAKASTKPSYTAEEVGALPNTTKIPTKVSELTNDSKYLTSYTETDPTVPSWAKASTKPSYTKSEVGLGNVDNVKQYSASNPPPYPVTKVNNKTGEVSLSASDVGADASGTASSAVSAHNTSTSAHADIREQINQLSASTKFDPTVYNLPVLYLTGDISPIFVSKDNEVTLNYTYGERTGTCTLKGQGASSYKMAKAFIDAGKAGKFNYTIKFDNKFEVKEGTIYEPKAENNRWFHDQWWGAQKKYCLKANWIDHTHARNVVSAKIWGGIVKSRANVDPALTALPCGGAVDGFPVVIMLNNEFHGLYTFNIPKDGWMFGLVEDSTKTQAMLGANDHEVATQFKGELAGDESDFELEFVSDKNNTAWVTTSLNRLINACVASNGGDLDTTVAQYLDWDSAIDYYIYTVLIRGEDMVDKNFLITTFDGTKWFFTTYDMDSTYGLSWDASGLNRPVSDISFDACASTSRVFDLIKRFKTDALKARYKTLRADILSESRIMQIFEKFAWDIPTTIKGEDVKKYPTIRGSSVNTIDQIGRWLRQRLATVDAWVDALPAQETPVEPEQPVEMVNLVPTSIDTDGSIYNGTGYKDNTRLSSSGGVSSSAQTGSVVTGFIEYTYKAPFIIRIKGATWLGESQIDNSTHWYLNFYDSNKAFSYGVPSGSLGESGNGGGFENQIQVSYDANTGVTTFDLTKSDTSNANLAKALKSAKYFRLNAKGKGSDLIVTVNQEITE